MPSSTDPQPKARKSRYTIDFDVEALKALKHLAIDLEVDASDILKYIVTRALEDQQWCTAIEQALAPKQ